MINSNRNFIWFALLTCPLILSCKRTDPAVEKLTKLGVAVENNGVHYVVSLQRYAPFNDHLIDSINDIEVLGAVHFNYTDINNEQFRRFSNRKNVQSLSIDNTGLELNFAKDFEKFDSLFVLHISDYQIEKNEVDFLLKMYPALQIYVLDENRFGKAYEGAAYNAGGTDSN